jgi:hypothetical protein
MLFLKGLFFYNSVIRHLLKSCVRQIFVLADKETKINKSLCVSLCHSRENAAEAPGAVQWARLAWTHARRLCECFLYTPFEVLFVLFCLVCFVLFFKFLFYSYVHTIFGSFLPLSPAPSLTLPLPPLPPLTPHYQAETILPLSLILLKREYKQ